MCVILLSIAPCSAQNSATFDPSFDAAVQAGQLGSVDEIVFQEDGMVLIGGQLSSVGGAIRRGVARIHPDGELDTSFDLGMDLYITPGPVGAPTLRPYVSTIAVQPDGKVLIGGIFDSVDVYEIHDLARLLPNGAVDTTFHWLGIGPFSTVRAIALQADGRILVAGTTVEDLGYTGLFRLHADGSYDDSFQIGTGFTASPPSLIHVQENGRILVAGEFTSYNGVQRRGLMRLLPDGEVDESFAIGSGTSSSVTAMDVYEDGTILIGGRFTSINGVPKVSFARIFPDGEIDPSFDAGSGAITDGSTANISALRILSDGRICAAGVWDDFQGQTSTGIMTCMLPDGNWDPTFGEVGANSFIREIAEQADGRILIGGMFFNGPGAPLPRNRIARILGNTVGLEEYDTAHQIDVVPNPAMDLVRINVDAQGEHYLSLYNSLAQEVYQQRFTYQATIDLSGLQAGVYQIIIRDRSGHVRSKQLLKQ